MIIAYHPNPSRSLTTSGRLEGTNTKIVGSAALDRPKPRIPAEFYSRASLGLFFNDIRNDRSNDNRRLIVSTDTGN